jgi:cytoskeletal protein CcmA (bactofilin family)
MGERLAFSFDKANLWADTMCVLRGALTCRYIVMHGGVESDVSRISMGEFNMRDHVSHTPGMTLIGSGTYFRGTLRVEVPLHLDGVFTGEIESTEGIVISENARIDANVIAPRVVLAGSYSGTMTVRERLQILPTGRFSGTLVQRIPVLSIAEGGVFKGEIVNEDHIPFVQDYTPLNPPAAYPGSPDIASLYDIEA